MSFESDMVKFAKKIDVTINDAVDAIKIELFNGVIRDTRVGNSDYWKVKPKGIYIGGRLRGNWQTTIGSPASGVLDRKDTFYNHEDGGDAQADVVKTKGNDVTYYLTNNLPYAQALEEEDGMIDTNMKRIKRHIKKVIK